jgi:hypothetical protein
MRSVRLTIALIILSPIFLLAFAESTRRPQLLAQVTAQPGPAPLTQPAAPGQPASFATIGALPALAPAPGTLRAPVPRAVATPRVFRCTCSAPGYWTNWAGTVSAPSYTLARREAAGQCVNFNLNSNARSPYFSPPSGSLSQRQLLSNGTAFNSAHAQIANGAGQTQPLNISKGQIAGECSQCACN